MRVLMFRLLMVLCTVLELLWLLVVIPGEAIARWLKRAADWAEIGWVLAVAVKKTGRKP